MCEDEDCDCHSKHQGHHYEGHHGHHMRGYSSIAKRTENQVKIPEVLLEVAEVGVGDFFEISIRKVKKEKKHSH
jgi:hypothetical protein